MRRLFTRLLLCAHVFCLLSVLSGMAAAAQPDQESQASRGRPCRQAGRQLPVCSQTGGTEQFVLPAFFPLAPSCLLGGIAAAHMPPPLLAALQCMDQLLKDLAAPGGATAGDAASPFKAFARRAQLVITGLVHISVLLLPHQHDEAGSSSAAASAKAGSSGGAKGSAGSAGSSRAAGSSTGNADAAAELAAAGFPSDGSNLEEWQRVRAAGCTAAWACLPVQPPAPSRAQLIALPLGAGPPAGARHSR